MSVKIKLRGNGKAIAKFNNPVDEQYFVYIMLIHRDDGMPHPQISIKDKNAKELNPLPKKPTAIKTEPKLIPPIQIMPIKTEVIESQPTGLLTHVEIPVPLDNISGFVGIQAGLSIEMEKQVKPEEKKDELG